jgi:hypothetical protein
VIRVSHLFSCAGWFWRKLAVPVAAFAGFCVLWVRGYMHLDGIRWQEALFWIFHQHAIESLRVQDAMKLFSIFVFVGCSRFKMGGRTRAGYDLEPAGMEVWRSMVNDISIKTVSNHFISCGYGQVGRTVVEQL